MLLAIYKVVIDLFFDTCTVDGYNGYVGISMKGSLGFAFSACDWNGDAVGKYHRFEWTFSPGSPENNLLIDANPFHLAKIDNVAIIPLWLPS